MCKQLLFLLVILLTFNQLEAQKTVDIFLINKYSDTSFLNKNAPFLLVQLPLKISASIKNEVEALAVRKFSPSIFIIKKNEAFVSSLKNSGATIIAANNNWKLSPAIEKISDKNALHRFTIQFSDTTFTTDVLSRLFKKENISVLTTQKIISVETTFKTIDKHFLQDERVTAIDIASKPFEELGTSGFDLSANNLANLSNTFPGLHGEGMHASIKEDFFDTTDIDLKGRFDPSPLASKNQSPHANFMATIIAGGGNSVYYAKGVASAAQISSSSFEQILPENDQYYTDNNITVQNHSYGTVIDNNYGLNAVAFDKSAHVNPFLLHVFSSGNVGNTTPSSGNYNGISSFANLTGNFKMAKNIITVAATDSFGNPVVLSSRGPAYDGRIKPDIAAFQKNGTSEAAALVSGTALLMQQLYKNKNNALLPSALARTVLINSADDVARPGPDYETGFGNMNAEKALQEINHENYFSGDVKNGDEQVFNLSVPEGISLLKVSLAWNDSAALPNAPTALVNDLDLSVASINPSQTFLPLVLSSVANTDSLSAIATRKRDSLNNEEQVTIENPAAGNYQIKIKGFRVLADSQKFYVAYSTDSLDYFKWKRFSAGDFARSNRDEIIRWQTNIQSNAEIAFAYPPFTSWQTISSNANLSQNYLYWHTPDTISHAMIRVTAAGKAYYSDTFLITELLAPTTGFICADSLLVYWNKAKKINRYQLYQLGEKYMTPLLQTNDTTVVINQQALGSRHIAVAPVLADGTIAAKSYAFDYTQQGAACYVSSLYADISGNIATINLALGTLYNVQSIYIQKLTSSVFTDVGALPVSNVLTYQYNYQPLTTGVSFFRAKIVLNNGSLIYSEQIKVYYNEPGAYLVFPVPVQRNQTLEIYTATPSEETFVLTDLLGRTLLQKQIQLVHEYVPLGNLPSGIYFYKIIKKDKSIVAGKLEVL